MIIVGIDPGLRATGFGIIRAEGGRLSLITAGDIQPLPKLPLANRLAIIHDELEQLFKLYRPAVAVLEKVFAHHKHVMTATLMAHARGVACLAAQEQGVSVEEYLPTRIKHALTGSGNASKEQVARMVVQWLGKGDAGWSRDATDALALAIAQAHISASRQNLAAGMAR